ncbi:hypothetical protein [Chondromyces crocatus]|uniref:Uncharacterized protein n=1 Tax=Chondromyces crocatus TaxID=52 RepID=A0A0K1E653_CHOCO|nr:hypothetical protein [Chondromyces crocatus]AKT36048.1 uncharacterized protein CMC5_001600 [Chondromyces crocatus]
MRLPAESTSSWTHVSYASFTWASLVAWSEFPDLSQDEREAIEVLATSMRSSIDTLLSAARATEQHVLFARPMTMARQNAWLRLLRRRAGEAQSMVTFKVGHSSMNHPQVREFLPKLRATITRKKIAERPFAAEKAATRLEGLIADFPEKPVLVQRLRDVATGAQAALDASKSSRATWSMGRSAEVVAKTRLRLELEKTHRLLGARFPGQRDFVESFFLRGSKPSEGNDQEEEGEEAVEQTKAVALVGAEEADVIDEADAEDEDADATLVDADEDPSPQSVSAAV